MALNFQDRGSASATRVLLVVLVVVSIACMTIYAREGADGPLHAVQSAFAGAAAPFKAAGTAVGAAGEGAAAAVADATASEETLTALRERNAELTELVTQAEEYRLEAERLSGLLELKDKYQVDGVSGRVIGRSTDAWNQRVTIDVGTSDGVEPGLTVMGPSGVVGQVVSASPGSAEVRLLTDPQSGAAAMVQSSRAEGVVRGSLAGLLYLENVDADVTLSVGDVVLTSGLGGSYTRGLLIGTIVRVDGNANDGTRRVIVSPNEQATSFEEVIVVKSAASDRSDNGGGGQ
ncbi:MULTISPECIES: rod shape-determining protein MreC [unclassified Adlercreutzia]|uniref:rod shape-determining protein MreC n=1 Tax=unclassified Adlercreutzia TaxID=2636013 RepID=UPI0013EB2B52|nr:MULTISPECIES: rod shape-determining protein MreC [unclassified Adlercreutzia]